MGNPLAASTALILFLLIVHHIPGGEAQRSDGQKGVSGRRGNGGRIAPTPATKRRAMTKKHAILRKVIRVVTTVDEENEDCVSKGGGACTSDKNCCYGACNRGFCPTADKIIKDNKPQRKVEQRARPREEEEEEGAVEINADPFDPFDSFLND